MLSDYLFEEIIELSKSRKLINKDLLKRIVIDLISKTDDITRKKFRKIIFVKENKFCGMAYPTLGKLEFCMSTFYRDIKAYKNTSTLTKNLHMIALILHEIEHLREEGKIDRNTYQGKLIKLSNLQEYDLLDDEIYYSDPSDAMSYKRLLIYLSNYPNFKKEYFKEYITIYNEYINMLQVGYVKLANGKYSIPLVHFLSGIKKISYLKDIGFKFVKKGEAVNINKMNLEKKFMYGFPIKNEEMKKLESKKFLIKKK